MFYKSCFVTFCFSLCFLFANAQTAMLNPQLFQDRVKLMSQFMHRFNGDEYHPSIKADDKDAIRKNLCQLFNIQNATKKSLESSAFMLIDSIISNNVKFYFEDPRWYAKATCVGTLKNQSVEFDLFLVKEKINKKDKSYKWVISNVIGDIFTLPPSKKTKKVFLSSNEHELRFMKLYQITTEKDDYITYYASDNHQMDPVSVFFTMVYTGLLNIDYVADLEFICHQVPGYSFTIQEFDEESSNSGWLINHWKKVNDDQKLAQLNMAYNNHYDAVWKEFERDLIEDINQNTMSDQEAITFVERFCESLNNYLCAPDSAHSEIINEFTTGRYSFRGPSLERSKNRIKLQGNAKLDDMLASFIKNGTHINHISFNDIEIFDNTDFKDHYKVFFKPVYAKIRLEGDANIDEQVIIFIYEDQIAGIKLLKDCF